MISGRGERTVRAISHKKDRNGGAQAATAADAQVRSDVSARDPRSVGPPRKQLKDNWPA